MVTAALSDFKTMGDPDLNRMRSAAVDYIHDVWRDRSNGRWLSFLGPSGTGKTMLARCIMRVINQTLLRFSPGCGVTLTDDSISRKWSDVVSEMKSGDFQSVDKLVERERKWNTEVGPTYRFALIDDIGQPDDSSKSYVIGALGRIADVRLGSWTIWTSNLSLEEVASRIDPRVASRMIRDNNVVIETDCQDFNVRKLNQK